MSRRARALATFHGVTVTGLADRLGYTRTHVGLVLNGRRRPSPDLAEGIAGILGEDPEFLFPDLQWSEVAA